MAAINYQQVGQQGTKNNYQNGQVQGVNFNQLNRGYGLASKVGDWSTGTLWGDMQKGFGSVSDYLFGTNFNANINPAAQSMAAPTGFSNVNAIADQANAGRSVYNPSTGEISQTSATNTANTSNIAGNNGPQMQETGELGFGDYFNAGVAAFNVWNSYQSTKLAKEEMAFQKEQYYTNLRNSVQSYNTNLQDRINGRHSSNERTQAQKDADYNKNKLES